jgi:bifunctional non-homologous end joining protein LigD
MPTARRSAVAAAPVWRRERPLPVRVSNPEKLFWPDDGYTKLDLVLFYNWIFPKLQPWTKDRLVSLKRCPYGIRGKCFHQKEKPEHMPPDTPTKRIVHANGIRNYIVGGKKETQLALVNLGCIAVHLWGARQDAPRQPDWVCFDVDPDSGKFSDAATAGVKIKAALDALKLVSFAKTSGKKGLHVFVPIRAGPDADEVLAFAQQLATQLARAYPKELTTESLIARRKGRVYLDSFRNGFAQTVAAPFCVRRFPRATVSTPLEWSEVRPDLDPTQFHMASFPKRLEKPDPWKDFFKAGQSLEKAMKAVKNL